MLLLTGASGLVGSAVLHRLVNEGQPVRCLARDPRRLGPLRVHVQIALGDLCDAHSFRNATRGVQTVVHLATATRDQPRGSIEEITAMATWRLLQVAQNTGVERFLLLSGLGASRHHPARLLRAKAIAEQALAESELRSTVIATSFTYAPNDRWLSLIERLATLGAVPVPGSGKARCQPIWAHDVAACVTACLRETPHELHSRYELAGPETLTYDEAIRTVLRCAGRQRPLAHVPRPLALRSMRAIERSGGHGAPLTWDEAQLLQADAICARGAADARALGVEPRSMTDVLS